MELCPISKAKRKKQKTKARSVWEENENKHTENYILLNAAEPNRRTPENSH